jgi:hypothetical protein
VVDSESTIGGTSNLELNELVKRLKDAAQKMQDDDKTVYIINESLQAGHGEGIYKFTLEAHKKEGSKASIPMGRDFFRDEVNYPTLTDEAWSVRSKSN